MKKKFKKRYILLFLAVCFLIYNIVWFVNWYSYRKMEKALGYNERYQSYVYKEDDFIYSVFPPHYLSLTGNYDISQSVKLYEKPTTIGMVIWPEFFGEYEVGIIIEHHYLDEATSNENEYNYKSEKIYILLDEHMKPKNKESEQALAENADMLDEIEAMYERAYKRWGILKQ